MILDVAMDDENPVTKAIARLGGITQAVAKSGYPQSTWYLWRTKGFITHGRKASHVSVLSGIPLQVLLGVQVVRRGKP